MRHRAAACFLNFGVLRLSLTAARVHDGGYYDTSPHFSLGNKLMELLKSFNFQDTTNLS